MHFACSPYHSNNWIDIHSLLSLLDQENRRLQTFKLKWFQNLLSDNVTVINSSFNRADLLHLLLIFLQSCQWSDLIYSNTNPYHAKLGSALSQHDIPSQKFITQITKCQSAMCQTRSKNLTISTDIEGQHHCGAHSCIGI